MNFASTSESDLRDLAAALAALEIKEEAERLEASLIEFYKAAWPTFDPAPYTHGWHLEAIAEHLEAVTYGQIRRLLITMPPRHSKTLLSSVTWPAWLWARARDEKHPLVGAQAKLLCLSYSDQIVLDNAILMRRLVQSPWYQERWGHRVQLTADQDAKSKFDTKAGGTRISASFGGTVTGRGGDIKIIDDPIKADDAESIVKRENVLRLYDGTLKSRVTDPRHHAEVIIMQRLHDDDLAGHVLKEKDPSLVHLNLPAEFEIANRCKTVIGWSDPRKLEGEPLWQERFGRKQLAPFKAKPHEWSAQWQQRPQIRGGNIFKRDWWQKWAPQDNKYPICHFKIAVLDAAYTEDSENDPSALVIMGAFDGPKGEPLVMLLSAWQKWLQINGNPSPRESRETPDQWCLRDSENWGLTDWVAYSCEKHKVHTLLIENKASGISVAQEMRRLHNRQEWTVQFVDPKDRDKRSRAFAVQDLFSGKRVFAPERDWAEVVIDQMARFRGVGDERNDLTDAVVYALQYMRNRGMAQLQNEYDEDEYDRALYKPPIRPLYPAT